MGTLQLGESEFTFLGPVTRTKEGYVLHSRAGERPVHPSDAQRLINGETLDIGELRSNTKPLPKKCSRKVPILKEDQAKQLIAKSSRGKPALLAFVAGWCGACAETKPEVREAARFACSSADVAMVDVDKAEKLSQRYKVEALPTIIAFRDGKPVARTEGVEESRHFVKMVERARASRKGKKGHGTKSRKRKA